MSLVDHAIWWHVYPLAALGAPIRPAAGGAEDVVHRLPRLEAWLDHAVGLGCSGLLLGPVFASTTHGYDTVDHFRIDPRLGDDADFDHLVAAARERGLAIVLDGVFNHVGGQHPLVAGALSDGPGLVRTEQVSTGEGGPVRRALPWEGHTDLALLDHDQPAVVDLVTDVMLHWLRRGISGWRLDVAYAVPSHFWREVLGRVRSEFPEALFIGEVIHGDYGRLALAGSLDSVTQYELWKGTWSALADRNLWELAWALERHNSLSAEGIVLQTFVGNHDVTRIATRVGDAGAALAAAVLLTVPGMPSIYYGDEHAFRGAKGVGVSADDEIRPELPAGPEALSPLGWWLHRLHQDLIDLRRRHPWVTRGSLEVLAKDNTSITYRVSSGGHRADGSRRADGSHRMDVRLALDPVASVEVDIDGVRAFAWTGTALAVG